jgi:hypothetical protein
VLGSVVVFGRTMAAAGAGAGAGGAVLKRESKQPAQGAWKAPPLQVCCVYKDHPPRCSVCSLQRP